MRRTAAWWAAVLVVGSAVVVLADGRPVVGQEAPTPSPTADAEGGGTWRMVDVGDRYACGIRTNGRLYCWGDDIDGQLGDGGGPTDRQSPTEVHGGHTDWVTVSSGQRHTCGRRSNGRLYCWGANNSGQLGTGGAWNEGSTVPALVAGGVTNWATVSAGVATTCARRTNGRLFCWGSDDDGELGNGGQNVNRHAPVEVAGRTTDWSHVSVGTGHVCARKRTGRLFCWGSDYYGQLGNDRFESDRRVPTEVAGRLRTWGAPSVANSHTCARRTNGRLFCWGHDGAGRLGNGTRDDSAVPMQVAGGATNWRAVGLAVFHSCATRSNGRLFCWGPNTTGKLGIGTSDLWVTVPRQVAGGATNWRQVSGGWGSTCAVRTDNRLFCWGDDYQGALGNGAGGNSNVPVEVS